MHHFHSKIHPVVLSGGSGSRLWPMSRASHPKQFLPILSKNTLLQDTIRRAIGISSETLQLQAPLLICNQEHRFLVREECIAAGITPAAIYLEPSGRNTAPAIALAALHLLNSATTDGPDPLMLVLPADHAIHKSSEFSAAIHKAFQVVQKGYLVAFGIHITEANVGYGYIHAGPSLNGISGAYSIDNFHEKPDQATAERYFTSREYTWNSGMFLFSAKKYLQELGQHRPEILEAVTKAWQNREEDMDFTRPQSETFLGCPSESVDYAVFQNTDQGAVVPMDIKWSDVGSWDALWDISDKNPDHNVLYGDVFSSHTRNSYLRAESRLVAVIGMENVVVVETADAVLVMRKDKAQDIKAAIEHLKSKDRKEHLEHRKVHRPWGWYEGIDHGDRFQVKRIMVKPNGKLSLQMHHHRAEHWIVVSGTAKVTIDSDVKLIGENESTYIPMGRKHRLENPGKIPLHLIEVQSGAYLGEDDIVRFEDKYDR